MADSQIGDQNLSGRRNTVVFSMALMAVICMMVIPLPSPLLDIGLAFSFALAILIFTTTLFVDKALDFSSFPTVLLTALTLRLSLNVASTKLIIGQGHTGTQAAGRVIEGFSNFVMGGSVFLGLVVFCVLLIVNFLVITKGATRMAEVGARFALDGMPGRQLAIDSDLANGAITHEEAKKRRELELRETTFLGSLDGASKFVKGDAVAGLLITLINLIVGLAIGTLSHGMDFTTALETYAILTVGDGLVSQIPAVIISIATAMLLAKVGDKGSADFNLIRQLGFHPSALATVGTIMIVFGLVPGMPAVPFIAGGVGLMIAAWMRYRFLSQPESQADAEVDAALPVEAPIGDSLDMDDLHIEFASDLVSMILDPGLGLEARIGSIRRHVASAFGLILPEIRLTDNPALDKGAYVIRLHGVEHGQGALHADMVLALAPDQIADLPEGHDVSEPVYGAPARWIRASDQDLVASNGGTVVVPIEIVATHLMEVIKDNLDRLLTLKSLRRMLRELTNLSDPDRSRANREFLDEVIPDQVPMDLLHAILRLLLRERVSVRNLPLILEAIVDARSRATQPADICELVRQRIGFQILAELRRPDGSVPILQLDPQWEERFATHRVNTDQAQSDVALPPDLFNALMQNAAASVSEASEKGLSPALAAPGHVRRFLHTVLRASGLSTPVLSFEEIGTDARPALVGTIAP